MTISEFSNTVVNFILAHGFSSTVQLILITALFIGSIFIRFRKIED